MEDASGNFASGSGDIFATIQGDATTTGEVLGEVNETHFATAPTCLVLTDDVRKIFAKGDPLIVGTSMSDIQTFFQKVIAEAQLGIEHNAPRSFLMNFGGRQSTGITAESARVDSRKERYPVPFTPFRRTKTGTTSASLRTATEKASRNTEETDEQQEMERCEIPLDAIKVYLSEKKYFPGWSANSKRNLRKRCDDFVLENGLLFYKTKKDKKVHCVEDRAERMRLIWQQHSIDHRRRDRLFSALKDKYYWKGMLQDVNRVLESCEFCARVREEKGPQTSSKEEEDDSVSVKKRTGKEGVASGGGASGGLTSGGGASGGGAKRKRHTAVSESSTLSASVAEEEPSFAVKEILLN